MGAGTRTASRDPSPCPDIGPGTQPRDKIKVLLLGKDEGFHRNLVSKENNAVSL